MSTSSLLSASNTVVPALSYGLSAAASLALMLSLLANWRPSARSVWILAACLFGFAWSIANAFAQQWAPWSLVAGALSGVVATAAWCAFLLGTLRSEQEGPAWSPGRPLFWLLAALVLVVAITVAADWTAMTMPAGQGRSALKLGLLGRLALALLALLLIENALRNCPPGARWGLKFFAIGLGGRFVYEFFMYADGFLFGRVNPELWAAAGVVNAIATSLVAVGVARSPGWAPRIHVSRQAAFYSTSLLGGGAYLLIMAAAGFYVREVGGGWGEFFQAIVLFTGVTGLVLVAASGRVRALIRGILGRHFYTHKHDYRREWPRFIETLSADDGYADLGERAIRAIADLFEVPDGALWMRAGPSFVLAASWNASSWDLEGAATVLDDGDPVVRILADRGVVVDIDDLPADSSRSWWHEASRPWLAVPLIHHDRALGLVALGRPRIRQDLADEDRELLLLVGRQAASYLAERSATEELIEARQFAEFNQRVTFVAHDIKNLASQLSLIVSNAGRHRHNPAFVDDMVATVQESVDKMRRLLGELGREEPTERLPERVPVRMAVEAAVDGQRGRMPAPRVELDNTAEVLVDRDRFITVLRHILQNAIEAAGPAGDVLVRTSGGAAEVVIEIIDNGPGMTRAFIRRELFRPFRSTKGEGYGLGAFESREFARRAGGRLEVDSAAGRGTTMRLVLPAATRPPFVQVQAEAS